jgi:hypothetical protein
LLAFNQGQAEVVTPVQPQQIERVEMLRASAAHKVGETAACRPGQGKTISPSNTASFTLRHASRDRQSAGKDM